MKRKFIYVSPGVCLVVSLLSAFFLPRDFFKLFIPITSFVLSLIISYFIVLYALPGGKKRIMITRYILSGLILVAIFAYLWIWNTLICKVADGKIENGHFITHYKHIITGTQLIPSPEMDDSVIIAINKSNLHCSVCDSLMEHNPDKIWRQQSILVSRVKYYGSFLLLVILASVLLVFVAMEIFLRNVLSPGVRVENKVFISYNHEDLAKANELLAVLKRNHIKTVIDKENMIAGEDINRFIRESVASSRITLLIVSENSLLSGWVVTETVNTFFKQSLDQGKYFIGCYIDKNFLSPGFSNKALTLVNERIEEVVADIRKHDDLNSDSRELNDQKSRLLLLRANLDLVLQRLQSSKCIDISDEALQGAIPEILRSVKSYFDKDD